jgi:hypothetical protein
MKFTLTLSLSNALFSVLVASAPIYLPTILPNLIATRTTEKHSRLTYPSLYDVCLTWKTPSAPAHLCTRMRLDRALLMQIQAAALLESAATLPTTVLLSLSPPPVSDDVESGHRAITGAGGKAGKILQSYRAMGGVAVRLRCGIGRMLAAIAGWFDFIDQRVIVALLALSGIAQVVLVCLIANDLMNVSWIPVDTNRVTCLIGSWRIGTKIAIAVIDDVTIMTENDG